MGQLAEGRVVEPVQDWAALENARLANAARAALLTSGSAVTVEALAGATGKSPSTVRRWIGRLRTAQRLVTVTHDGQMYVPTFQLTDAGAVDPAAAKLVSQLVGYGMDGWAVWDWVMTPNSWLGGDTPRRCLAAGDSVSVARAVDGLLQA
jgi:hypothetical protein